MPEVIQQIKIIASFQSDISGMKKAINSLEKMRASGAISQSTFEEWNKNLEEQNSGLYDTARGMMAYEQKQRELNKKQQEAKSGARKLTGAYLSLMFTGMALTRVFGGMVKSVLDVLGIGEMLSATILVVLLPALEPVAEILYAIMDFFMNLPEPIQKIIGFIVLIAAAIGIVMTVVGMFLTFFSGGWAIIGKAVVWLWGLFTGFVGWVAGALGVSFGAALAIIIGIIVLVIAIVVGAIDAWKNNFLGFKDAVIGVWSAIKTYIMGFVQFFTGIWDIIAGVFTGNTDKIKQGFGLMGEGIKNIFKGIANFVINIINTLVSLVLVTIAELIRGLEWAWNKIPGVHTTIYKDIMAAGAGKNLIPTFQQGGVMPYTGLAMVHAGETITPKGESMSSGEITTINNSPTFNITANVSNEYDVRKLATELNKYWTSDMERISKARGMI